MKLPIMSAETDFKRKKDFMNYPNYCFKITLLDGALILLTKSGTTYKGSLFDENSKKTCFEHVAHPGGIICSKFYFTFFIKQMPITDGATLRLLNTSTLWQCNF